MLKLLDQPAWSRSDAAVGLGLLYRLTGDKAYARRAQALVQADLDSGWWNVIGPIHDPPHRVIAAVYAWDLIHDACDASFRAELPRRARAHMRYLDNFGDIDRGNGHPRANWSAQYTSGIALAALADSGMEPDPPPEAGIQALTPPPRIPDGLPVLPFDAAGRELGRWLVAGPFELGLGRDGLESIGGSAKAEVRDGLRFPVKVKGAETRGAKAKDEFRQPGYWTRSRGDDLRPLTREIEGIFKPILPKWINTPAELKEPHLCFLLQQASGGAANPTFYFAAAVSVLAATTVRIRFENKQRVDPCVYIAGRKFLVNELVQLAPGVYPVLQPVTMTAYIHNHGREKGRYHWFELVPVGADEAASYLHHRKAVRDFHDLAATKLAGTPYADAWAHLWLAYARARNEDWIHHAITEGGWNIAGDCYALPSLQAIGPFAHAYAVATGTGAASPGNLGRVLPHQVLKTVFSADRAYAPAYGRGGGPYGPMPYARCFSFVEPALKPVVGWAAHRTLELALAGKLKSENLVVADVDPFTAAFALTSWPTPDAVKPPPAGIPLIQADRQRCAWTFRNRFQDGDDAVAMFAGFVHPGGDWDDDFRSSGDFRLAALGHEWAIRGGDDRDGVNCANRVKPAVVNGAPMFPKVAYRETSRRNADGTAAVTLDLHAKEQVEDKEILGPPLGSRTFFVDYSGACGAPVLVVVLDRLPSASKAAASGFDPGLGDRAKKGGKAPKPDPNKPARPMEENQHLHRWQMVTEPSLQVAARKGGFTLTAADGASLAATVLSPSDARVVSRPASPVMELNYHQDHRGGPLSRTVVEVPGDETFLVVLTVQRGPAPPVELSGERLKVGPKTLRVGAAGVGTGP